jgi:hypothetical protein
MTDRLRGSAQHGLFMFFLTFVWSFQQVATFLFVMTGIAITVQASERISRISPLLLLRCKAKFNEENFQIMNLIRAQPAMKAIFF